MRGATHLQCICSNLVGKPNAPPFLLQVDHDPWRVILDVLQRQLQLLCAIAFHGPQHFCAQALSSARRGRRGGAFNATRTNEDSAVSMTDVVLNCLLCKRTR